MEQLVYLNGEIVAYGDARVPVEDRGYQFGDGIYEVIRVYNGRPFRHDAHFDRLQRSAEAILLDVDTGKLKRDALVLLERQQLTEASIYVQVTRGTAIRNHPVPAECTATTVMLVRPASAPATAVRENGVSAILLADDRWARCYIKSTNLLPNILAKQQAVKAGAYEAIYQRDGYVTEGSSSNVYAVFGGELWTAPKTNYILGGITRDVVLEIARADGISVREESFAATRLAEADEILVSSTTAEIVPVVTLEGKAIGSGRPGAVYQRLAALFQDAVERECGGTVARAR